MISNIFIVLELILKAVGLWNQFLDYLDKKYLADMEKRRQSREKAVDDQKKAETEKDFDDAQDRIISNKP